MLTACIRNVTPACFFYVKLRNLNVDVKIMQLFYSSVIESLITFGIGCWYGCCTKSSKDKIDKIINTCTKLGLSNSSLHKLFETNSLKQCNKIILDNNHPLNTMYVKLPSGRRWRCEATRTSRYANTFVPQTIKLLNHNSQ